MLGPAVHFSQECNAIVCRGRDLDLPIPAADPALNREVKRWLDLQLANLREEPAQQVREIIAMLLPSGLCSVERVAKQLGMHRRTFSRHMAAEGESYETIFNAVRAELAQEYLANSKRKLQEVADLLGFSGVRRLLPLVSQPVRHAALGLGRSPSRRKGARGVCTAPRRARVPIR